MFCVSIQCYVHSVYQLLCLCRAKESLFNMNHQFQAFTQGVHCPVVCSVHEGFSMKSVPVFVNFILQTDHLQERWNVGLTSSLKPVCFQVQDLWVGHVWAESTSSTELLSFIYFFCI